MRYEFPGCGRPVDPSWWAPLEGVGRAVQSQWRYQFFALADFMLMVKLVRPPRPSLYLYKHRYTRRYLNLDEAGHAYRFAVPRSKPEGPGRYLAHRNPADAIDHLELWLLPWMKPGLESWRFGYDWSERYLARDSLDPIDDASSAEEDLRISVATGADGR